MSHLKYFYHISTQSSICIALICSYCFLLRLIKYLSIYLPITFSGIVRKRMTNSVYSLQSNGITKKLAVAFMKCQ